MFSGAGSNADSVLPAFPTTVSTSGIRATAISNCCKIRLFSATPACGIEVGISKNEPSLSEGINSSPVFRIILNPAMMIANGKTRNNILLANAQCKMRV